MTMSGIRALIASLLFVLPFAVSAVPLQGRHGGHDAGGHEESGHTHTHGFAIKAHGTLLTLAFSFLYPAGVVLIRGGLKRGFLMHWTTQGGATVAALTGMSLMIVKSWKRLIVRLPHLLYYPRSQSRSVDGAVYFCSCTLTTRPRFTERTSRQTPLHRHCAPLCHLRASHARLLSSRSLCKAAPTYLC
jgi:hypothetical protein